MITGGNRNAFYDRFQDKTAMNRLCIIEDRSYDGTITNLAAGTPAFQWHNYKNDGAMGEINRDHKGRYNNRIWDPSDLKTAFSSGADVVNANLDQLDEFNKMVSSQDPRGRSPSLSIRGKDAVLVWRGASSDNLYAAVGSIEAGLLKFPRQVLLSWLLEEKPLAHSTQVTFMNDGRMLAIYKGTEAERLWYVSGRFSRYPGRVTFDGKQQRLTTPDDKRRGYSPAVACAPDGRVVAVYQGTSDNKLWYVSGTLSQGGVLEGNEYQLEPSRGANPSVAFDAQGRVIVVYEGTNDNKLWYVSGRLNSQGKIEGKEFSLTEGDSRKGFTPSVAFDPTGNVLVVYRGTAEERLYYVFGQLDSQGKINGKEFQLTEGDARRGYDPTAVFDGSGRVFVSYEGTSDQKLWYVSGSISLNGGIVGTEVRIDMSCPRY